MPQDTLKQIFRFLPAHSLLASEMVCKLWRDLASKDDAHWEVRDEDGSEGCEGGRVGGREDDNWLFFVRGSPSPFIFTACAFSAPPSFSSALFPPSLLPSHLQGTVQADLWHISPENFSPPPDPVKLLYMLTYSPSPFPTPPSLPRSSLPSSQELCKRTYGISPEKFSPPPDPVKLLYMLTYSPSPSPTPPSLPYLAPSFPPPRNCARGPMVFLLTIFLRRQIPSSCSTC